MALDQLARKAAEQQVPIVQQAIDDVVRSHGGEPVAEVKSALQRRWAEMGPGASITDPELTIYAEYISEGRPVKVRVGDAA